MSLERDVLGPIGPTEDFKARIAELNRFKLFLEQFIAFAMRDNTDSLDVQVNSIYTDVESSRAIKIDGRNVSIYLDLHGGKGIDSYLCQQIIVYRDDKNEDESNRTDGNIEIALKINKGSLEVGLANGCYNLVFDSGIKPDDESAPYLIDTLEILEKVKKMLRGWMEPKMRELEKKGDVSELSEKARLRIEEVLSYWKKALSSEA